MSHAEILEQGVAAWNEWRAANPDIVPDLTSLDCPPGCDLSRLDLTNSDLRRSDWSRVNLQGAILRNANLTSANFCAADLTDADLTNADLTCASLMFATLRRATLQGANLMCANFAHADLCEANLREAALYGAFLAEADLEGADLSGASVYGVSVWETNLKNARQTKLTVTPPGQLSVTVDHLEIAQFIALVIQNAEFKQFLETVTSKLVLLLGRFSAEHKPALEALKFALAERDYVPVLFDFDGPRGRNTTETVTALAHMAKFIIADVTEPKSVPAELQAIVPNLPSVPVRLICAAGTNVYPMADAILQRPNAVKKIFPYRDPQHLAASLDERIVGPISDILQQIECRNRLTGAALLEDA